MNGFTSVFAKSKTENIGAGFCIGVLQISDDGRCSFFPFILEGEFDTFDIRAYQDAAWEEFRLIVSWFWFHQQGELPAW